MSELKPGYWKLNGDVIVELFAERDGNWFGRQVITVAGESVPNYWEPHALSASIVEYIGHTLPPDPGEGWRLLRKGDDPEPAKPGDEFLTGSGSGWLKVVQPASQYTMYWYRRRVTPEPPQPPEGWELLPDGTEWNDDYLRYWTGNNKWEQQAPANFDPSGPRQKNHVWYARRIEPEPVCPWCVKPVPNPERYIHCPHCYGSFSFNKPAVPSIEPEPFEGELRWFKCENPSLRSSPQYDFRGGQWYVQRQYHAGEWRDVGVQP